MQLSDFATFDEYRAAVGVTVDELDDETLGLPLYEDTLIAEFEDVSISLPDAIETVSALAEPSAEQERFLRCARSFARYAVARQLTVTLPIFSPVKVEDGKAAMTRMADPYKATTDRVAKEFERWRGRLAEAYQALGSSATTSARAYLKVVSPGSDPVTGA